ncbi:GNAT family N-acetyltransferase [Streptococcus sp. S784/96/1]|uniref:GNAT family N-acetyltransferase n=1 Tax=Streptococcus sp. S784/96/1 TaxID=2653499 RepID=UPI00138A3281|nr:GNAT family N-acetyltransferase [Streptococcus sp. S784/96/1]
MICYEKLVLSEQNLSELTQLTSLSEQWAEEKTMPSYTPNKTEAFLNRELYVVREDDTIIAYALGDIKILTEKTSYNAIGESAFELDELYVKLEYRSQGIGQELYRFMENDLLNKVSVIGVIAASYHYFELLKFYSDDLGMSFNHALLTKRL